MFDRVFNLKPNSENIHQLSESNALQLNNIEYIAESLRPIVLTMDQDELKSFPSKILNYVRLRMKRITPVKPPKIIVFSHPARTELRSHLKNVADYFDLKSVSLEHVLVEQRDKLKRLGPNCHEVLTRQLEVPDDVDSFNRDCHCIHAISTEEHPLPVQRLVDEQLPEEQRAAESVHQAKKRSMHRRFA